MIQVELLGINNTMDRIDSKLDTIEKKDSECKSTAIETMQNEMHRKQEFLNLKGLLVSCSTTSAVLSSQSCMTLCEPMDCSPPGSSVHSISQARKLEWVAISFSRGSSRPREWTCISCISCIARLIHHKILQDNYRKMPTSASLTRSKPLTVRITKNGGKFLQRWEYQTTFPIFWEICMYVKKQQLEPDMEQWNDSELGKEYVKVVYCHPAFLTYMQSTSWGMPGWMTHKLESRLPGKISITFDIQKVKRN